MMNNGSHAPMQKPSPVQEGVQLVQNMVQCRMSPGHYQTEIARLHQLMGDFALREIRAEYEGHMREVDPDYQLTVAEVTSEENESTPMAEAYWAATSLFFRKVYQAAAAAA